MTVRPGALTPDVETILPLLARVEPIARESLLSLLSRAAEANVFPNLGDMLSLAGIAGHPAFAPFTLREAGPLTQLLGVVPGEVAMRLHRQLETSEQVDWAGARMDRRLIEARRRRVSPASLRRSPHHRLAWTHRALSFCPESFEVLISNCPRCLRELGWTKTAGSYRCEHCRADLRDAVASLVAPDIRPALQHAAALVDHDPQVRGAALAGLPPAFQAFDPGEAFAAIIELGVVWTHPEAQRGSRIACDLSEGRLDFFTEAHLAHGHKAAMGWPDSFGDLLGRIERAGGARSMSVRELGVFGRWFDVRRACMPFAHLLREAVGPAALVGRAAVKHGSLRHLGAALPAGLLTLTEAQTKFAVAKATLGRLVPDGESCAGGRLGRGGGARLDAARSARAVAAYKTSLRPQSVANRLGVPAYMLDAFADAGLLRRVDDPDALRLAGSALLLEAESLDLLIGELQRDDWVEEPACPLGAVLARRYSPQVWVAVFDALRSGRLKAYRDEFRGGDALTDVLVVERDAVVRLIKRIRRRPIPKGVVVNGEAAARLVGVAPEHLPELIEAGLIKAQRRGRGWAIRLEVLARFSRSWLLSTELAREGGPLERFKTNAFTDRDVFTRHLTAWPRSEVLETVKPGAGRPNSHRKG